MPSFKRAPAEREARERRGGPGPAAQALTAERMPMDRRADHAAAGDRPKVASENDMRVPNRLIHEKSPYLLQHAYNPVDWQPWGEEAFAQARRQNRPIFLSVGYSTCHWCHVMERESFENVEIAALLNAHFVSIKVDREERPDVDRVYMTFVQSATGRGGWPMSVWLTPELKPFLGGTYFPPDDRGDQPGLRTILEELARLWQADRAGLIEQAERAMSGLREPAAAASRRRVGVPSREVFRSAYEQLAAAFDGRHGGFGDAPKFPRPTVFSFLFRIDADEYPTSPSAQHARHMARFTLRKMADGGIHDHLGGGFHRYAVDAGWHVPHFEKMLYDQAQLAVAYLEAYQITREPCFAETARDILDYVRHDLTSPEGGFYSAEDADSPVAANVSQHAEGAFYVWTLEELRRALGQSDARILARHYGVEPGGNVPSHSDPHGEMAGRNVLIQRQSVGETAREFELREADVERILADGRRKLREIRSRRPRPQLDDQIITAWNGLMISAFARAGALFEEAAYVQAAVEAAAFLKAQLYRGTDHTLLRAYRQGPSRVNGFLADYVFLVQGLLDLYETSFDAKWLLWAVELQQAQDALFWDHAAGVYFDTGGQDPSILLRIHEDFDAAEPAANSVAVLNLLRLGHLLDAGDLLGQAGRVLDGFADRIRTAPTAMPLLLVALDFSLASPLAIVIAGRKDAPDTAAMLREVRCHFLPHRVLALADGGEGPKLLGPGSAWFRNLATIDGRATAYVCQDRACRTPVTDPRLLAQQIQLKETLRGPNPLAPNTIGISPNC